MTESGLPARTQFDADVVSPFWYVSARGYGLLVGPLGTKPVAQLWAEKYRGIGYEIVVSQNEKPEVAECYRCGREMNPSRAGTWSNGQYDCTDCCRDVVNKLLSSFENLADMEADRLQITE